MTEIEKVHIQCLKRILVAIRSVTNVMIRTEDGRHSLLEQVATANLN